MSKTEAGDESFEEEMERKGVLPHIKAAKNASHVAERIHAIKKKLHERNSLAKQESKVDKIQSPQTLEQLMEEKLHQLRLEQESQMSMKREIPRELPSLPQSELDTLMKRTSAYESYILERCQWDEIDHRIQEKVKAADDIAEELKEKVMELTTNAPNLCFDDRATRWRSIVATRTQSELLRKDADESLSTLHSTKLSNPYAVFSALNVPETASPSNQIESSTCDVWLIGRRGVIENAEKNTDTVIYYGAYLPSEGAIGPKDKPRDGLRWLPCSNDAIEPSPIVEHKKATVESWIVSGAGLSIVNGVYVLSGRFEGASKYTSVAGLELFRKKFSLQTQDFGQVDDVTAPLNIERESVPIPAKFHAIYNERDFKVMQLIGSWLAMQVVKEKTHAEAIKESHRRANQSTGDEIEPSRATIQPIREENSLVVHSRATAVPRLCRAWVLLQCHNFQCLHRHYYISFDERERMKHWQQAIEANLDMTILRAITSRELLIERAKSVGAKAMAKYMANMHQETFKQVQKLVQIVSALRLTTVHVIEAIDAWREHVQLIGRTTSLHAHEDDEIKLGWSVTVTVTTGRQLYKSSNAFLSKVKRYCRDADASGQAETEVRYLGYFRTKVEAESAYDNAVVTEAKRLHTTVDHLPRKRYVFLSCGKHFAIESEDIISKIPKSKSICIECRAVTKSEPWVPTYLWHGINYLLKIGSDLDFLDEIQPLKQYVGDSFPLVGNPFLVPKGLTTDAEKFINLTVPEASNSDGILSPNTQFTIHENNLVTWTNPETQETYVVNPKHTITTNELSQMEYEILDMQRLSRAQNIFVLEFQRKDIKNEQSEVNSPPLENQSLAIEDTYSMRKIQALYWDRCAALSISQVRPPRAFRLPNVWCRLDAGEWAGFRVRGRNLRSHLFQKQLYDTGAKTQVNRNAFIQKLRAYMKLGIEEINRQEMETFLIEAEAIRGDVVKLEAGNLRKFMEKYDRQYAAAFAIETWWRRVKAIWQAKMRRLILNRISQLRLEFQNLVTRLAQSTVVDILKVGVRMTVWKIEKPAFTTILKLDGEHVAVSWHGLFHASNPLRVGKPCVYCLRQPYNSNSFTRNFRFQKHQNFCYCTHEFVPENIFVRAYNPSTCQIYRLMLNEAQIRELLRPHADGFLEAACNLGSLPTDRILNYGSIQNGSQRRKFWEPVRESMIAHLVATSSEKQALYLEKLAQRLWQKLIAWRALHTNNLHMKKMAWTAFQKAKAQTDRAYETLETSTHFAKEALMFSERARTTLIDEQVWDPLENANNWRLLVSKRLAERDAIEKSNQLEIFRMEWFHAEMNETSTRALTNEAKVRYDHIAAMAKIARQHANEFSAIANASKTLMQTAFKLLSGLLALRFTSALPIRRNLILLDKSQTSYFEKSTKIHSIVPRRDYNYNLLVARGRKVWSENIRCTTRISQYWFFEVRTFAETASLDADILVTGYRPHDSRVQEMYVERRFLTLLVTRLRFRDPLARIIQHHMKISGTKLLRGDALSRKILQYTELAWAIVHLMKLDPFSGNITVGRLEFFRTRESLEMKIVKSHWWCDLLAGRKRGRGDEVYRQATNIDGKNFHTVVYENWGDLTIQVYEPLTRIYMTKFIKLMEIFCALKNEPSKLHHWILCVRTNRYTDVVFQPIFEHLVVDNSSLYFHLSKMPGKLVHRSVRFVRNKYILVQIRQNKSGHLRIGVFDTNMQGQVAGTLEIDPSGLRAMFSRDCKRKSEIYKQLENMIDIRMKQSTLIIAKGQILAEAIRGFNKFVSTMRQSRCMLNEIQTEEWRRWESELDSCDARCHLSAKWTPVLVKEIDFLQLTRPSVYCKDVVYNKNNGLCYTKLEVFPCKGDYLLRLRGELFNEWELRREELFRVQMQAEEEYTKKGIIFNSFRAAQSMLAKSAQLLSTTLVQIKNLKGVLKNVNCWNLDKQIQMLANQYVLAMEIIEVIKESGKEYFVSPPNGIEWLNNGEFTSSFCILEPVTKLHKIPTDQVIAKISKVAMFARPIQVECFIIKTDDTNVWKFEVYGKAIGLVASSFARMDHLIAEFHHEISQLSEEDYIRRAFKWLCNESASVPTASFWSKFCEVLQDESPWRLLLQSIKKITPLLLDLRDFMASPGLFRPNLNCEILPKDSIEVILTVLLSGIETIIRDVNNGDEEFILEFSRGMRDPFFKSSPTDYKVNIQRPQTPPPVKQQTTWQMLIPVDMASAIEEIYLEEPILEASVMKILKSELVKQTRAIGGELFFVESVDCAGQNVRASALRGSPVVGVAFYTCKSPEIFDLLCQIKAFSQIKKNASSKLAPWRVYGNERIRVARSAKPSHKHLPLQKNEDEDIVVRKSPTWHPSNDVSTLLCRRIKKKELEYILGIESMEELPQLAATRFCDALEYPSLNCTNFEASLIYFKSLELRVVDEDGICRMHVSVQVKIFVNDINRPTSIIIRALDDANTLGAPELKLVVGWDPLISRPIHGEEWVMFAMKILPTIAFRRQNGQIELVKEPWHKFNLLSHQVKIPLAPIQVQYKASVNRIPADNASWIIGHARLKKHSATSLNERMRKRNERMKFESGKSAIEWLSIMKEDIASREFRGILTLPRRQLEILRRAFDAGTLKGKNEPALQHAAILKALGSSSLTLENDPTINQLWRYHTFAEWWRQADLERRHKESHKNESNA